ncbi:MAG TPA: helix-turn-helix transcriptional regulator [Firmicutes bacterium]|nr:helix-turn-helix transcriptional regulator [Bacillota bacterium]
MSTGTCPISPIDRVLDQYGFAIEAGFKHHNSPFWHRHRGIEIIFVHSGNVETYSRTWRHTLHPGELAMALAQPDHGSNGRFNRTVVHFVPDLVSTETCNKVARLLDNADGCLTTSLQPDSATRLIWAARQLVTLCNKDGSLPSIQALIGLIVAEIEVALNRTPCSNTSEVLHMVVDYMRTNIAGQEKLEWLAERFNISSRHLHHLFVNRLGCSPYQYWLSLKLEHACRLLQGDQHIRDISAAVGFQSLRGFQRAFQRQYHLTPSEYRAQARSPHRLEMSSPQ